MTWLIEWTVWVNDFDQSAVLEGPYGSRSDAQEAASTRWPLIDPEQDATWTLVPVWPAGQSPSAIRAHGSDIGQAPASGE